MADLLLLTGLPGIGKTTVVERLVAREVRTFTRVHFGALLRESVERRLSRVMTHCEFRARFAETLTYADIEAATAGAREQADRAEAAICLLDSHAVTPPDVGIRVTPDTAERLAVLR